MTRQLAPAPPVAEPVTVLVRDGAGYGLRRQASAVETGVPGPDQRTAWDRLTIEGSSLYAMADEVMSFGPDAYAESPPTLRDQVVRRLTEAAS